MTLEESYKILGLPLNVSKTQVELKYKELCERYSQGSSMDDYKALAEVKQAYFTILKCMANREAIAVREPEYVLQRKPVVGKLKEVLNLHGMKVLTASAILAGVLISVPMFTRLAGTIGSIGSDLASYFESAVSVSENSSSEQPAKPSKLPVLETSPIVYEDVEAEPSFIGTETGHVIESRDGVTYVDGYLVVNKSHPLPDDYVPANPNVPVTGDNGAEFLDAETMTAFEDMRKDASSKGLNLWIASGYRSYDYQRRLYNKYSKVDGSGADAYSARPGYSEHQTGLAFDLNSVTRSFASTREGIWVNENCYKYGFIIRYPKDKTSETGYTYEPWHLRYVGVELATQLYNGGDWITMETYFGLTSQYGVQEEQAQHIRK